MLLHFKLKIKITYEHEKIFVHYAYIFNKQSPHKMKIDLKHPGMFVLLYDIVSHTSTVLKPFVGLFFCVMVVVIIFKRATDLTFFNKVYIY